MKGIVLDLLRSVVVREHGEDAWDDLLDRAALDGAYTAHGTYGDDELLALLAALDRPGTAHEQLRWFGRSAMPLMRERYAGFFSPHERTADFLRTVNDAIHPSVRVLYPGADLPVFDLSDAHWSHDQVVMGYRSSRRLCALAEGFVLGAAEVFGERAEVHQERCMHDGDELCVLVARFGLLEDVARGAVAEAVR